MKCFHLFSNSAPFLLVRGSFLPLIISSSVYFPLFRYILTSFYTKYDRVHFVVNTVSLLTVLIPKLPQLHGVRIFGINKYWRGRRGHLLPRVPVDCWEHTKYQASDLATDPQGSLAFWLPAVLSGALNEACWGYCRVTKPQDRDTILYMESTKGMRIVVIVWGLSHLSYSFSRHLWKRIMPISVEMTSFCEMTGVKSTNVACHNPSTGTLR